MVIKTRVDPRVGGLVVLGCALFWLTGLRPVGYLLSLLFLGYAGVTTARLTLRPRSWLDLVLASWTAGVAGLLVIAELLSVPRLLGSPIAWVVASGIAAVAASVATSMRPVAWPAALSRPDPRLPWWALPWLVAFLLQLTTAFTLTWFAGINIADSIGTYLPRSVRYLQHGTLNVHSTFLDTTPYLHQVLIAHQLVFLRSDVLVNPLSFVAVLVSSATVYAFVRSLHWHGYLPLIAACLPFTMPIWLMHASTSNFDTLEAAWLVLSLYFLRRGAPGPSPRWLLFAALATALALATKPTFYFAAPALGLLWLAIGARSLRRRGLWLSVRWLAACTAVIVVIGMPYLARNVALYGTPLGSETGRVDEYILGPPVTLGERVRRIIFTDGALLTQLLTPPSLFGSLSEEPVNQWFRSTAMSIGYELPDPKVSLYGSWDRLLRHGYERYGSGHASFGAAFVLVLVPSIVALAVGWRRLGPRRWFLLACLGVALVYSVVLAALFRYDPHHTRYLIEMVAMLTVLAPVIFFVLPRKLAVAYALGVSTLLLVEMRDVIVNNRQMPLANVTVVPRGEQYYRYFGATSAAMLNAMRAFQQKYPVGEFPDVYIDFRNAPEVYDYGFLGSSLERRTHYWSPVAPGSTVPPGIFLTNDPLLVAKFADRDDVSIDPLSINTWVILPNDRLRVVYSVVRPLGAGPLTLSLRAAAPATGYSRPEFRFSLVGEGERVLQEFSPRSDASVLLEQPVIVRVDLRDADDRSPPQVYYIESRRYLDL